MRVFCRVREERARLGQPGLGVEFFTHAKADAAAEQRHGLGVGMGMRWHLVVGRQLDALDDDLAGFCRVAHQDGDLATGFSRARLASDHPPQLAKRIAFPT